MRSTQLVRQMLSIQRYLGKQYNNSNVITFWSAASLFYKWTTNCSTGMKLPMWNTQPWHLHRCNYLSDLLREQQLQTTTSNAEALGNVHPNRTSTGHWQFELEMTMHINIVLNLSIVVAQCSMVRPLKNDSTVPSCTCPSHLSLWEKP